MPRVLVTGATGLIGRAAVRAVAEAGHEAVPLSRSGQSVGGVAGLACDLLDPDRTAATLRETGATHLLHLAWHGGGGDRWGAQANLDWMAATLNLVRTFRAEGGTRAVCAGSCAEYDWSEPVLSETTPLRPRSLYGAAKAGTGLALTHAAPGMGLSLLWARIFFVYGRGEPRGRLLGDLIHALRKGEAVDCTDGLQERDFLHADDLGALLAHLLTADAQGPLNLASGTAIPVRALIGEVARQIGRPDLVRLGARPRPPDDPPRLAADITRLRHTLSDIALRDLPSGVAEVLADARPAGAGT